MGYFNLLTDKWNLVHCKKQTLNYAGCSVLGYDTT